MAKATRSRFDLVGCNKGMQFNKKYLMSQSCICDNHNEKSFNKKYLVSQSCVFVDSTVEVGDISQEKRTSYNVVSSKMNNISLLERLETELQENLHNDLTKKFFSITSHQLIPPFSTSPLLARFGSLFLNMYKFYSNENGILKTKAFLRD